MTPSAPWPPVMAPQVPPSAAGRSNGRPTSVRALLREVDWSPAFLGILLYVFTITSLRIPLGAVAVALAGLGLLVQGGRVRFPGFIRWFAAYLLWASLGLLSTRYPEVVGNQLIATAKLWIIALVAVNAIKSWAQLRLFLIGFLATFCLFPMRGAFMNYFIYGYSWRGRALWNGDFGNPNDLAVMTLLLLAIAVGLVRTERRNLAGYGAIAGVGLLPVLLLLTQSRGGILAAVVFVLALLAGSRKRGRVMAALAVLITVGAVAAPSSVWDRLGGLTRVAGTSDFREVDEEGSAAERFRIWQTAFRIIHDHPISGTGLGTYPITNALYEPRLGRRDTHSTYFNVMAEAGIIGCVLFVGMIASTLRGAWRTYRRARRWFPERAEQLRLLLCGMAGFLVAAIWGTYCGLSFLYLQLAVITVLAALLEAAVPRGRPAAAAQGQPSHRPRTGG